MTVRVLLDLPVTNNLTALAGGALVGATPLTTGYNEVNTVVTAGDSVVLPPAVQGMTCWVNNMGAAGTTGVKIYGNQSNPFNGNVADSIVAHGANTLTLGSTGVSLALGHVSVFICSTQGQWKQVGDFA